MTDVAVSDDLAKDRPPQSIGMLCDAAVCRLLAISRDTSQPCSQADRRQVSNNVSWTAANPRCHISGTLTDRQKGGLPGYPYHAKQRPCPVVDGSQGSFFSEVLICPYLVGVFHAWPQGFSYLLPVTLAQPFSDW